MACPLCGCQKPLSQTALADVNQPLRVLGNPKTRPAKAASAGSARIITLGEIRHRGDLDWLRRKIYLRCVDIIKTLTDAQGRSRARHPADGKES